MTGEVGGWRRTRGRAGYDGGDGTATEGREGEERGEGRSGTKVVITPGRGRGPICAGDWISADKTLIPKIDFTRLARSEGIRTPIRYPLTHATNLRPSSPRHRPSGLPGVSLAPASWPPWPPCSSCSQTPIASSLRLHSILTTSLSLQKLW